MNKTQLQLKNLGYLLLSFVIRIIHLITKQKNILGFISSVMIFFYAITEIQTQWLVLSVSFISFFFGVVFMCKTISSLFPDVRLS